MDSSLRDSPLRGAGFASVLHQRVALAGRTEGFSSKPHAPDKTKGPDKRGLLFYWRRARDSNPRYATNVYTLSRRAPSATRTALQINCLFYPICPSWTGQEHAACSLLGLAPSPLRGRRQRRRSLGEPRVSHSDSSPDKLSFYPICPSWTG